MPIYQRHYIVVELKEIKIDWLAKVITEDIEIILNV